MSTSLNGMRVAILVTDGFEQIELTSPKAALEKEGATTIIASDQKGQVQGFHHDKKADHFLVEQIFDNIDPNDFDAVLLPGGVQNSDTIRLNQPAQRFVQAMQKQHKPIAVICHGAWLLVSAGLVKGRTLTSWPSLQDDIRNAGGEWVDQQVVTNDNWISSRKPDDLPAFNKAVIKTISDYKQQSVRGTEDENAVGLAAG
ncbi:MAG: type 1 glutamine amidotransferase domain-containing protein [Oxalicibacterium faecigallinarum]|uniref:type 1 glutamine amidotransferase domain-containing protein n=1 Tax=Oxalicibacterium faecigallinarum TaxID=573741 RepID=UPI0028081A7B|nr:type 1 glutamine amidotransferase domain-containing protein [Oxalicibacterium faecigallinarum]MDQ7970408.1 type 1 glutamine amidotransferase domain-containing protein [Oxalicibacterium faecigallinarum]